MSDAEQLSFADLDWQMGRAEARAWEDFGTRPMWPWVSMLRDVASRLADRYQRRNDEIYQQLMLLEEEIQSDRERAVILERIGRAKGLLSVCLFALVLHGVVVAAVTDGEPLRRPVGRVRVRREEVAL